MQHGSDRHPVILKNSNRLLTVLDLENELERITTVPVKDQRLYFKSHELDLTPFKSLKDCGLVNNSFVKLVGEPSKMRYSNLFGRLNPTNKPDSTSTTAHQFFTNNGLNSNHQSTYSPSFQRFSTLTTGNTNYLNHGGVNHHLVNNQQTNHSNNVSNNQTHGNINMNHVQPSAHQNTNNFNALHHNSLPVNSNSNIFHNSPAQTNNFINSNHVNTI